MKRYLSVCFLFISITLNAQVDSIEYCLGIEIFDFDIKNQQYFFRMWDDGSMVETDSIIFQTETFFNNYTDKRYIHGSEDSVQLAIASRTLKTFYGEDILFNKSIPFIRICWLKGINPTIFKIIKTPEGLQANVKIGDGNYDRHGSVLLDSSFYLSKKIVKRIEAHLNDTSLFELDNGAFCTEHVYLAKVFYFEIHDGKKYNVFVVNECNLEKKPYKKIFELYRILEKKSLPRFSGRGAGVSKWYRILRKLRC